MNAAVGTEVAIVSEIAVLLKIALEVEARDEREVRLL